MKELKIIEATNAPTTNNILWLNNNSLYRLGANGWEKLKFTDIITWEDIQNKPNIPSEYKLPAATITTLGGVKKAATVNNTDVSDAATIQSVGNTINALLESLRNAGILN